MIVPAGIWILLPYHQPGQIIYEKGRYKQKGRGIIQAYMRVFAQEGLGRPDLDVITDVDAMRKFFQKYFPDQEIPEIQSALVMTNEKAEIDAENAPTPVV